MAIPIPSYLEGVLLLRVYRGYLGRGLADMIGGAEIFSCPTSSMKRIIFSGKQRFARTGWNARSYAERQTPSVQF